MPAIVTIGVDGASSVQDILKTLPACCHGFFLQPFEDTYQGALKYYAATYAEKEFQRFLGENKIPTAINSVKTPTLQVTDEFRAAVPGSSYGKLESQTRLFRNTLLQAFKTVKGEEKEYFHNAYITVQAMTSRLNPASEKMCLDLKTRFGVGREEQLPPSVQADLKRIQEEGMTRMSGCIDLAHNQHELRKAKAQLKREKKSAVEKKAAGPGSAGKEPTLEKTVESVLKRREQARRDQKKAGQKKKGNILFSLDFSKHELLTNTHRQSLETSRTLQTERKGVKRKIIEEAANVLAVKSKRFCVAKLDTYPERFFQASLEAQELFFLMQCRRRTLLELRIMNYDVFKAHGVELPQHIEMSLAMNLKHLFVPNMSLSLAAPAWASAATRLRKEEYFRDWETTDERLPRYLEGFDHGVEWTEKGSAMLESGLAQGYRACLRTTEKLITRVPDRRDPPWEFTELQCRPSDLKRFMLLNHYMAFITDKNLGVAVVKRDRYLDELRKFLSDTSTFMQISEEDSQDGLDWVISTTNKFARNASLPVKIQEFLEREVCHDIPKFHMIPKVHKTPWKLRPIVPMHSYVTTRLAMVVHHYLHPMLREFPWICESSRKFTRDILTWEKKRDRYMPRLFTGDVVSMYTNIKNATLLAALRSFLREEGTYEEDLITFLCDAVRFLNESVLFQASGQVFWQKSGVAMGLACAPTLANLFMGIWERRIGVDKLFQFYRRYIDDIFAVTKGEVLNDLVSIPGLELTWESMVSIPFLDCEVHLHDEEICIRPYSKPLSHYQYIPWSSSHPLHVKRGLVKTELLRFSSLSGKRAYFDERKKKFHEHLAARGYPERALKAWMKQVQWRDPTIAPLPRNKEGTSRALFAESKYNPFWEQASLQPVWDAFLTEITQWPGEPVPVAFEKLTLSLQRSPSMWDLLRRLNRDMLADFATLPPNAKHQSER